MPWECFECTFVQEGSPSGRGPCIMCMHDNPLRIKVEVEDAGASPSPAPKITGTDVETKDLMSDVASLKAFAEAITESAAAVCCSSSCWDPLGDHDPWTSWACCCLPAAGDRCCCC